MTPNAIAPRRRFLRTAGAALSVPLAAAGVHAAAHDPGDEAAALRARLGALEDTQAIRELHQTYVRHLNAREYGAVASLFAGGAVAPVPAGISRVTWDPAVQPEVMELAADRTSAIARIPCAAERETPLDPTCTLVEMALQQGGGVVTSVEHGLFENVYVKEDGAWRIRQLAYRRVPERG
jgi:hypothetical protein